MAALPEELRVKVVPGFHGDVRVNDLLVGLQFRHSGRTYYSTLLGLTNGAGELEVSGAALARDYRLSQQEFPMDYRLKLEQCDDTAIVGIGGGADFEARRALALAAPLLREPYRSWWAAAHDEEVAADQTAVALDGTSKQACLTARRVGVP